MNHDWAKAAENLTKENNNYWSAEPGKPADDQWQPSENNTTEPVYNLADPQAPAAPETTEAPRSEDPMASPLYWYDLQQKFEAQPYVDEQNPGYQSPDGWTKEFTDSIVTDFQNRAPENNTLPWYQRESYREDDPTWQMIQTQRSQRQNQTPEPAGQTGEAYQPAGTQQPETKPETTTGAETTEPQNTGLLNKLLPNLPKPEAKPEAERTEIPVTTTPQESVWENETLHKLFIDTYTRIGYDPERAEELARRTAENLPDDQAKNILLMEAVGTPLVNTYKDIGSNLADIGKTIIGINPDTGAYDRGAYRNLYHEGLEYYRQHAAGIPENHHTFAKKYAEYQWRTQTGEQYNTAIDLTGFDQYLPETQQNQNIETKGTFFGLRNLPGQTEEQTPAEEQLPPNPVNTPAQEQPSADTTALAANLWQIMGDIDGDHTPLPTEWEDITVTPEMMDDYLIQLTDMEADGTLAEMLSIPTDGGSIANMGAYEKALFYFTTKADGTTVQGASAAKENLGHNVVTTAMSATVMSNIGEVIGMLFGPAGAKTGKVIGLAIGFGIPYTEQLWGYELPYYDQILEAFDYLADWVEGTYGKFALAYKDALGEVPFTDPGKYYRDLFRGIKNSGKIYDAWLENEKDYSQKAWDIVAPMAYNLGLSYDTGNLERGLMSIVPTIKAAAKGQNPERYRLGENEVYRYNLGYAEKFQLSSDPAERFTTLLEYAQNLLDNGVSEQAVERRITQLVSRTMGTNDFVYEIIQNEATDPLNLAEGQTANTVYAVGKLTGDQNMVKAAAAAGGGRINPMDFATMPGSEQILTAIGKTIGKEWQKTAGLTEIIEAYHNENRFGSLENTTAFGRKFSGISKEGTLEDLQPLTHGGKNLYQKTINGIKNFFSTTDETRLLKMTDISQTFVNVGLARANGDPVKLNNFINQLENPGTIPNTSPLYDLTQSAAFNTYREDLAESVRLQDNRIRAVINSWNTLAGNRAVLADISQKLGMSIDETIDLAESSPYKFQQRVLEYARTDQTILDPQNYYARTFNQIKPFIKTHDHPYRSPWSSQELTFQISSLIGDGMQTVYLNKYNIKPDTSLKGTIYRFADTIKASQNFFLLGISGTYLPNNIINNVVTRRMVGIGGFSRTSTIENYFNRIGVRSERFGDSIAYEIGQKSTGKETQYVRMQQALDARKEIKGKLTQIKDAANWVNQHIGIMGNLSGKVEESESKQAIYSGTKQYIDRTWRPGINLTPMDAGLIAALDAQAPGLKDQIYNTIHDSLSMEEINDALFGDYIRPSLKNTLLELARERYGAGAADIVGQMFEKTGFLDQLKEQLEGQDAEGRARVFEEFAARLEAENAFQVSQHLTTVTEAVKTEVTLGGFKQAIAHAIQMADTDIAVRLGGMDEWSRKFTQRLHEPMTVEQWQHDIAQLQQKISANYQQLYAEKKLIYDGILQGLGMDDAHKTAWLTALANQQNLWTIYYQYQQQAFAAYRANAAHSPGESIEAWQIRAQTAWLEYQQTMLDAYNQSAGLELQYQQQMDQAFAEGFRAATQLGSELDFIDQTLTDIRNIRAQQIDLNKQIRQAEQTLQTFTEKDTLWKKYEQQRIDLANQITTKQKELFERLRPFEQLVHKTYPNPAAIDYNAILRADIEHREATQLTDAADKLSDTLAEKLTGPVSHINLDGLNFLELPTINEADDLITDIASRNDLSDPDLDTLIVTVYRAAGLTDPADITPSEADTSLLLKLPPEDFQKILDLSTRYTLTAQRQLVLENEAARLADDIAHRVYRGKEYNKEARKLARDIYTITLDIAKGTQTDSERFTRISDRITPADWDAINQLAQNHKTQLQQLTDGTETPADTAPRLTTVPRPHPAAFGPYTITAEIKDQTGKTIALVPQNLPVSELKPWSDSQPTTGQRPQAAEVSFPVIGISPDNPLAIVCLIEGEPHTVDPANWQPQTENNAYAPPVAPDTIQPLDPAPMANQELLYKDILPLLDGLAAQYEADLLDAQTMSIADLDPQTRAAVKDYLDNTVARDLTNTKYMALRFGEMMRDAALLNYSERYGFDNFLTLLAPYQFWLTRSMNNWMKRMASHPRHYSHYFRMKEIEEEQEERYLPDRLMGKLGIPMVGWPEYMGGRTFINPAQLNPLNSFFDPLRTIDDDKHVLERRTETQLERMLEAEQITSEEYLQALSHEGPIWEMAFNEISGRDYNDPNLGSLWETYFSPSLPVNYLTAYLKGDTENLNSLPSTRLGNTLAAAIENTNPEGTVTKNTAKAVRQIISAPERAIKDLLGIEYNEFGSYGDYLILRRLRSMLTDGEIDASQFYGAWMQKDGNEYYEKAYADVRREMALKTPGGGLLMSLSDLSPESDNDAPLSEKIAGIMLQTILSPFGQTVYTAGEETYRKLTPEYQAALDEYAKGNKEPLTRFYKDHPDRSTQKVLNKTDDPEYQLRYSLYQVITDTYYDLDPTRQQDVQDALGTGFTRGILDKDTRAWETMPIKELAAYARALNGTLPYAQTPELKDMDIPQTDIRYTPDSVVAKVQNYYDYKKQNFPGIDEIQNAYYSLETKEERRQFLEQQPILEQYWEWNRQYKAANPDAAAILQRNNTLRSNKAAAPLYEALSPVVQGALTDAALTGEDIPQWVTWYIQQAQAQTKTADVTDKDLLTYIRTNL